MKRYVRLIVLVLLLALVACGGNKTQISQSKGIWNQSNWDSPIWQ
jgi:hypothetical protein